MFTFEKTTLESFFSTHNIINFAVSPDEQKLVFSTNLSGSFNLWGMDLGRNYPYQLTTVNQTSSFIKFDPENRFLLTGYDHDGDENYHIYALPTKGGTPKAILTEEGEKFYYGDLNKDGTRLYYTTSVDNPNFLNVCRMDFVTGEKEVLLRGSGGAVTFEGISPSEASFAYVQAIGNTKAYGYVQLENEAIFLAPEMEEQPHQVRNIRYFDDDVVFMTTNYGGEFSYIASFDLNSRSFEKVTEIEGFELSKLTIDYNNEKLYFVAQRGVEDQLYSFDIRSKELSRLYPPVDIIDKVVIGDKGTAFVLGRSAKTPANIYKSDGGNKWAKLTDHGVIGMENADLTEPEVLIYPSFDGREIEALFYKPKADVDNGHTILWPHGGPQAAERKTFRPLFQYLCYQGYRIFSPNFRGSTGYGESFMKLVNKDWGGGPRLDIVTGMQWLDMQGKSESGKWFCVGGSYGGYMTLLLHGRHADLFKAFVDIFGPSNLFTTIETAPEHWKAADAELIGDAEVDRDKLIEDSPMTYIDQMTRPMLVIQGKNDPRVVKVESDVIVDALRKKGQEVEYLVLEDEGHGFTKTENAIKVYKALTTFLRGQL